VKGVIIMEPDPALAAIKTYRYLRIALTALVVLLFTSIAVEWGAADQCVQPSISAYYFTPVKAVFIGVLVTMGASLLALKGNTDGEDVLMNIAGMLAPGVAFIPTVVSGVCGSNTAGDGIADAVANNMTALFVTGLAVGVTVLLIVRRENRGGVTARDGSELNESLSPQGRRGLALSALVLGAGVVWFFADRESFLARGHDAAAIPMFLAIIAVVWLNARDVRRAMQQGSVPQDRSRYVAMYRVVAVSMLAALVTTVGLSLLTGSTSLVFWVEVALLILFAVFWVIQTVELWERGLRRP
jgi:hypothetical protein